VKSYKMLPAHNLMNGNESLPYQNIWQYIQV